MAMFVFNLQFLDKIKWDTYYVYLRWFPPVLTAPHNTITLCVCANGNKGLLLDGTLCACARWWHNRCAVILCVVLLLCYTSALPYRHCTLIKLLWARVARSVLLVFEHDLTRDALLENGLNDIRCCYHSNIRQSITIKL